MEFTSDQKTQLQRILARSDLLQTNASRRDFLEICGLGKYSSLVQEQSLNNFAISILARLSKDSITVENAKRPALIVFLEYLVQMDASLSQVDQDFINDIISKWKQWQRTSSVQLQPPSPPRPDRLPIEQRRQQPLINYKSPGKQPSVAKPSVLTVGSVSTLSKKVWLIMLLMIASWVIVGKFSPKDMPSNEVPIALLVFGATGGLFSGMGGWLAWRWVDNSVKWEQAIPCLIVGAIGGAVVWAIVGITVSSDILQSNGHVLGFIMGLIAVAVMLWWLALIRSRA
ncbi:MAG: hypothetical protein Fur006_61440 [Coleofasciculaceae cyanobacterium]